MTSLRERAVVAAYRTGARVVSWLPHWIARALGWVIGVVMMLIDGDRRRMVVRHQRRVHGRALPRGEERRLVRQAFTSYARYWVEIFALPSISPAHVERMFSGDGLYRIDESLARGKGAILALPHLGGWEWAGAWVANGGNHLTVVVEALSPPGLFEWFVELRERMGMTVVPLGPDAGAAVLAALRRNEIVCLLSDRDLGGNGISVEFFGEETTLPAGPATLALRSGADLLPTAVYFTGDGHLGVVRPPLDTSRTGTFRADVARLTQSLAGELESLIRRAPQQWHLMQPNWPSDLLDDV